MYNIKTPKGTVKKGIAIFNKTTTSTGLSLPQGSPIPFGESSVYNDSNNIILQSQTRIKLKSGVKYKLTAQACLTTSITAGVVLRFYNVTTSSFIGSIGRITPPTDTSNNNFSSNAECIIKPDVDTEIELRSNNSCTITTIYNGTKVIVEELETYLIPVDPTRDTKTINFTGATGTGSNGIVIPSGLPIGTKYLCRKINATQGTVEISCSGETFTASALSSITLNSDGDFWLVEKVSSTRWDLVEGIESGTNSYGSYTKYANGVLEQLIEHTGAMSYISVYYGSINIFYFTKILPVNFYNNNYFALYGKIRDESNTAIQISFELLDVDKCIFRYLSTSGSVTNSTVNIKLIGRWY